MKAGTPLAPLFLVSLAAVGYETALTRYCASSLYDSHEPPIIEPPTFEPTGREPPSRVAPFR